MEENVTLDGQTITREKLQEIISTNTDKTKAIKEVAPGVYKTLVKLQEGN